MKNLKYIFFFCFISLLTGCNEDILDKKPLDQYSDVDFWVDPNLAVTAINQLYKYLGPDDSFHDWEAYTDNSLDGILWTPSHTFAQKGWTAGDANNNMRFWTMDADLHGPPWVSSTSTTWKVCYKEIRDCNNAIKNLSAIENRSERLDQLLAEAKFVRAYIYHRLTRLFGGVIIVDEPLGLDADVNLPRNTYNECVDFMVQDLEDAAAVLPEVWTGNNLGRATSGAALALKGRIELFAERWSDAATSYKEVIDDGNYQLFPDFQTLFFEENESNSEVVLEIQFLFPNFIYHGNSQALPTSQNGWGAANPSQGLVDDFELLDGKSWDDPTSIYYDEDDPYANRDERFYATVQYDQGVYFGKRLETGAGVDGNGNLVKGIEIDANNDVTQTGYYLAKGIDYRGDLIYEAGTAVPIKGTNVIMMRYAEVLLSYAEAQNEAVGPDASVYSAVDEVRNRAGLPGLPPGLSQSEMQTRIRKERRVELAFEHMYYYDCLRWRDRSRFAERPEVVSIEYTYDLNPDGSVKTDETFRKIVLDREFTYGEYVEPRVFNLDTDYGWFFPIPQEEIDKNPNIVQNGSFDGNSK